MNLRIVPNKAIKGFHRMLTTDYTKGVKESIKEGFWEGIEEIKEDYTKDYSYSDKNREDKILCGLPPEKFSLGVSDKTDIKDMKSIK